MVLLVLTAGAIIAAGNWLVVHCCFELMIKFSANKKTAGCNC
jgi:hypothetical protein